jgi:hypothetical protein
MGPARLRLASPVQPSDIVTIQRNTPIDQALVQFQNGAVLTQEDLNTAVQQLLYKQQELQALYDGTLKRARIYLGDANGVVTNPEEVVKELANLVLEDEVLAQFRQRISDIDLTAAALAQQAVAITQQGDQITETVTANSQLGSLLNGIASDLTALQGVVDGLTNLEDGTGIATVIQQEKDQRIIGDQALAATIALIGAKSGTSSAFLLDLNNVRVSPTESLAQRLTAIKAATDNAAAAIQAELKARADGDTAEATARETLAATLRGETDSKVSAAVITERDARISADSAEAKARSDLAATLRSESTAAIQNEQKARADAISAEATARTTLASTLRGEMAASIQIEAQTRAQQDGVFTTLFTLLGAKNAAGSAFILNDNAVQLSNGQSLATRLSGLDTTIGNVNAAIVNSDKARVDGDKANADSIQLVSTTVSGHTASIGTLSQSVNGVLARHGVSLDVNGYVTGYVQNNDGKTGSFVILANRFAVVDPNGGNPTVPFEVSNGNVYVNGQRITPGTITADRLSVVSLSALTANIGFLVSYNGQGGRVERDGNGTRIYGNNGVLRVKIGF